MKKWGQDNHKEVVVTDIEEILPKGQLLRHTTTHKRKNRRLRALTRTARPGNFRDLLLVIVSK